MPEMPLGGFIPTYKSMAGVGDSKLREDILWDLENLFIPRRIKDFNLKEFELPITAQELKPLLSALQINTYFRSFVAKKFQFDKNEMAAIVEFLKNNASIDELVLEKDGINASSVALLCDAMTANKSLALTKLSLADNPLDDKGLTSVGNYIGSINRGLVSLNLARCNGNKAGGVSVGNALKKNAHMTATLNTLDLSSNKLEGDGSFSVSSFLANPNALVSLNLSNTAANLEAIFSALTRGCPQLKALDVSGNKMDKKASVALSKFLTCATELTDLNMSNTTLLPDFLKDILTAISGNPYLKELRVNFGENKLGVAGARVFVSVVDKLRHVVALDLHDNEFGDEGVAIVAQGLTNNNCIKHLNLDANFKTRSKDKGKHTIETLSSLIASENSALESLSVAGGAKSELRVDILPFLYNLGTNTSLKFLDVSGHLIGNKGASALGKALQTNEVLETLKWDGNTTTAAGFATFIVGLKRNFTLKNMPLPISDIAAALKGNEAAEVTKLVSKIEKLILRNQSPSSQFLSEQTEAGTNSQFAFLASAGREETQKIANKIKATGRKIDDKKGVMADVAKQDQLLTGLFQSKDDVQQQFELELKNQLVKFVTSCNPLFSSLKGELIKKILATINSNVKSLDAQILKRLNTFLEYGGKDLPEDEFVRILCGHAHAELCQKANTAFHSTVTITSDYLYERFLAMLEDIEDEMNESIKSEQTKAEPTKAEPPKEEPKTPAKGTTAAASPRIASPSATASPPTTPIIGVKPLPPPASRKPVPPPSSAKPGAPSAAAPSGPAGDINTAPKVEGNLEHLNKSKPMGQAGRKPPTRKARPPPPSATPM
eukprot:TRINITY_DN2522_c0_g1_i1.p1 TRINITY_DN2522_c0_g1~~TRINITY_DN2522_c0_g1_i1.p1  ORF type:complete len:980 (+),score=425.95 TRINITY_DN2522_c0_g1_i1:440-2941(+)